MDQNQSTSPNELRVDIAYGRVSSPQPEPGAKPTSWQGQQEHSLETQWNSLREWHDKLGFPEILMRIEDDLSGGREDRPGLIQTRQLIRQGKVKRLFLYNDSRGARDQYIMHKLMWHCFNFGVEVWIRSWGRQVDWQSGDDRLQIGFNALMNELWLRDHQTAVREGLRRAREAGRPLGSQGFGLRRSPHGLREIVPHEAAVVRRIFEEAANGDSDGHIAQRLEFDRRAGQIPGPRHGGPWKASAVYYIRANPVYLGKTVLDWRKNRAGGKRPIEEQREIPHTHPPIISQALYDRAQRRHRKRGRPSAC